jgi:hypothetical protein
MSPDRSVSVTKLSAADPPRHCHGDARPDLPCTHAFAESRKCEGRRGEVGACGEAEPRAV